MGVAPDSTAPPPGGRAAPSAGPASPAATSLGHSAGTDAPPAAPVPVAPRPTEIPLASGHGLEDADLAGGDSAFERGELGDALDHYEAARKEAPASPAAMVGIARVRIAKLGLPLDYAAGKGNATVAAVAAQLAQVAKSATSFGPLFVELGRARLLLGNAPGSLDALKNGVRLLPDEPEAHSQLGVAFLATGHADDAVRELALAAELDPTSGARHGNLGTALLMLGRTKEAIVEYEARVRIDDDAKAHSDLGTALLGTQDTERALAELGHAVRIEPGRATFHSNLGFALQETGRLDRAILEYREALRLDPTLTSAWINLATALARDPKTRAEARAALERARVLSPGDPRVKANLEELRALESGPKGGGSGP
jgi:Flp pilus assembly protein TadD